MSIPTVNDIKYIEVSGDCQEKRPCGHYCKVVLQDGRSRSGFDSYEIWGLVSAVAKERINPKEEKSDWVLRHFKGYSAPCEDLGWKVQKAENVLARYFGSSCTYLIDN